MTVRVVLVGVAALVLAGCGTSTPPPATSSLNVSAMAAAEAAAAEAKMPSNTPTPQPAVIPRPDASQSAQLLSALGAVDPGLNRDRSVGRARNVCQDILGGMDHAQVLSRAEYRFEGGTVPSLSPDQVERILVVITTTFCK